MSDYKKLIKEFLIRWKDKQPKAWEDMIDK